jgi:hypothetical protein
MSLLSMGPRQLLARGLVTVSAFLTLIGAAVVYYSLRDTHPRTARWANLMSLVGFVFWSTPEATEWLLHAGKVEAAVLGALGVLVTPLSIRFARTTPFEPEPVTIHSAPPPDEELKPTASPSSLVE